MLEIQKESFMNNSMIDWKTFAAV